MVERNVDAAFRSRIEQTLLPWIFAHRMNVRAIRDALGNLFPRLPKIAGHERIGLQVVELVRINCRIRGPRIMRRRFDKADHAPFRNPLGRDVAPRFSAISRNVNQAIIGARPDQTLL